MAKQIRVQPKGTPYGHPQPEVQQNLKTMRDVLGDMDMRIWPDKDKSYPYVLRAMEIARAQRAKAKPNG